MQNANPVNIQASAKAFRFDFNTRSKPIEEWETLDLVPFRCPHQFSQCIEAVCNDDTYMLNFEHGVALQLYASIYIRGAGMRISIEEIPNQYNKPPMHYSSIIVGFPEFQQFTSAFRRFDYLIHLNASILREANLIANKDTLIVRGADGRLAENPRSFRNVMAQIADPPIKKPWWHF